MKTIRLPSLTADNPNFYIKSFIFATLSILAAAFNYFLYPIAARLLGVIVFGDFSVLIALVTQIGAILLAFNVISITLVSNFGEEKAKVYLMSIQKVLLITFLAVALVAIILSPFILQSLKIHNLFGLIVSLACISLSIPVAIWSGYFQGLGELQKVGLFNLCAAVLKLFLVVIGSVVYGLAGAMLGVFLGTLFSLVIFWFLPGRKPPITSSLKLTNQDLNHIKKFRSLIVTSIISVGAVSLLQMLDLLYIKSAFSSKTSGLYSGSNSIAKILYYIGFILIWILLSEIASANSAHRKKLIRNSYLLFILMSVVYVLALITVGRLALSILLGNLYNDSYTYLIWATVFQGAALMVSFQTFVLLLEKTKATMYIIPLFIAATLAILSLLKPNALASIGILSLGTIGLAIVLGIMLWLKNGKDEKKTY